MVIPLPAFLIDLLLALSISLALVILMVSMYTQQPLEFSTFPSVLLVVTLFRLALNVASTRLILLHGHEGSGAAGHVIRAFGNFVVGGSYVVGLVVFLILVVINFAVITKGAGRIAEVAARFTLDAMPGKQLAIDADLHSGLVTETDARVGRRPGLGGGGAAAHEPARPLAGERHPRCLRAAPRPAVPALHRARRGDGRARGGGRRQPGAGGRDARGGRRAGRLTPEGGPRRGARAARPDGARGRLRAGPARRAGGGERRRPRGAYPDAPAQPRPRDGLHRPARPHPRQPPDPAERVRDPAEGRGGGAR